jgi:hypothetical protein
MSPFSYFFEDFGGKPEPIVEFILDPILLSGLTGVSGDSYKIFWVVDEVFTAFFVFEEPL